MRSEDIIVCKLRSASMIHVPVVMDGKTVNALVDTAAQATVISDKLLESFSNKPEVSKEITMHAAGRDMTMRAYKLKPIDIYIGKQCFSQEVYLRSNRGRYATRFGFPVRASSQIKHGNQQDAVR